MTITALRRWWPLAAVVVLLAVAAVAAAHSTPQLDRIPESRRADTPPTQSAEPTASEPAAPTPTAGQELSDELLPSWVPLLLAGLLLLLLAGVVVALLWAVIRALFQRRYGEAPALAGGVEAPAVDAAEVVAAVEAGLDDLSDLDADPRRAVIACWLRLEEAARAAGVPRRVGDTSTDLVTRLLAGGGVVSAEVLAGFAEVYRRARFATAAVDVRMREQARAALVRLRAELTGVSA